MNNNKKKVIVAMSGGVDSSVSAYILQQNGYHVEGLFMKNWEEDDNEKYCHAAVDLADTQEVCKKLGIKLHTINFATEFWNKVFEPFLAKYKEGYTPNPDILCNKEIKFKTFLNFAIEDLGADYVATGHYVCSNNINGKNQLLRAFDSKKDQSYFLYTLTHQQISRSLFPIGKFKKSSVRRIAKKLNLVNANKKGSTGICFIGKRNFHKFIEKYLPVQSVGKIITTDGYKVGYHKGLVYYTLGQRKGLGIGGTKKGNGNPWYVVDKNIKNNTLVVGQGHNHPHLMSVGLIAKQLQLHRTNYKLINNNTFYCTVKTRYRQDDIPCTVNVINNDCIKVYFDRPVAAVTPGQSAVFYKDRVCLGGGIIVQRLPQ